MPASSAHQYPFDELAPESLDMAFDQMDFNFGGGHGGGSEHDLGNADEPHSPFEHHVD